MASLQSIEVFIAVVQNQSFSAAGKQLGVVQSVVSAQLRALEEWMGFALLQPNRRAGALSTEGEAVYLKALRVQGLVRALKEQLMAWPGGNVSAISSSSICSPTLKQLETFALVVRLGTLERAAQHLNVTAAATARRLQELESLTGLKLFLHPRRKTDVSAAGQMLLQHTQVIGEAYADLAALRKNQKLPIKAINIGLTELIAMTWFPEFVRNMRAAYPYIALHPDVDLAVNLRAKLLQGDLDVALIPESAADTRLAMVPVGAVDFAWFSAPGTFQNQSQVTLAEIVEQPLLVQGRESGLNAITDHLFARHGLRPQQVFGSNSLVALAGLVASGIGVACLPRPLFQNQVQRGRLVMVETAVTIPQAKYCTAFVRSKHAAWGYLVASIAQQSSDFENAVAH